jgi:hypothetical protein
MLQAAQRALLHGRRRRIPLHPPLPVSAHPIGTANADSNAKSR